MLFSEPTLPPQKPSGRQSRGYRHRRVSHFPEFDPAKPDDTDFQLQQALVVAKALASAQSNGTAN